MESSSRPFATRLRGASLLVVCASACLAGSPAALADGKAARETPPRVARLAGLPAENHYLPLLLRLARLPTEDESVIQNDLRAAEQGPATPVDPRTRLLAAEMARAITAIPSPPTHSEIWPPGDTADPDSPQWSPPFYDLRLLARLSLLEAQRSPDASACVEICAGVTRLGRSLRREPRTIVVHMIGVVLEGYARQTLTARLAGFSRTDLDAIERHAAGLLPAREGLDAFVGEFEYMELSARRHYLPALKHFAAASDPDRPAGFVLGIRCRGRMTVKGKTVILLEDIASKTTRRMAPGETWNGVTFEKVSDDGKRAHLRRAEDPVVLDIAAQTVAAEPAEIARLRELLLGGFAFGDDAEARIGGLMEGLQTAVRSHPAGADGWLADSLRRTRTLVGHHLAEAQRANTADMRPPEAGLLEDPLASLASAAFAKITRLQAGKDVEAALFSAALRLRRQQLGGSPASLPPDPWGDGQTRFAHEATADGGFILRSAFEIAPGIRASITVVPELSPRPAS